MRAEALRLESLCKTVRGELILNNLSLTIAQGEVVSLQGMNSLEAGVLAELLAGSARPDHGAIYISDRRFRPAGSIPAGLSGVHIIHETDALLPNLTVAENVVLAREMRRFRSRARAAKEAEESLALLGSNGPDPNALVADLTEQERSLAELARAAYLRPAVLFFRQAYLFDRTETAEKLRPVFRAICRRGTGILYTSEHADQAAQVADRIGTVQHGMCVAMRDRSAYFSGLPGEDAAPERRDLSAGDVSFEIDGLCGERFSDFSIRVARGECVGIYDRSGAALDELLEMLCGARQIRRGTILLDGRVLRLRSVREAVQCGIAYSSPALQNLYIPGLSLADNILLPALRRTAGYGVRRRKAERFYLNQLARQSRIAPGEFGRQEAPSGYVREKAILARGLAANPRVLLLNNPLVGLDPETEQEMIRCIRATAAEGTMVLVASMNARSLAAICQRVVYMGDERI